MDIQFVYFDLDDTLLDHQHAEHAALNDVKRHFGAFHAVPIATLCETYRACSGPLWRQYAAGTIGKSALKLGRFKQLLDALDISTLRPQTVSDYYLQRYAAHWRFIPNARDAFVHVAGRFPVGVLTNGFTEIQTKKLDRFPVLRDRSESVVITEETGYLKPHPKAFAHAAEGTNCSPEHILYVGDSYHSDVQGGHRAGWHVAWYVRNRNGTPSPERTPRITFEDWDMLLNHLQ